CKDLISRILKIDPKERLTLEQIRDHQWVNKNNELPHLEFHNPISINCSNDFTVDSQVLEELISLGFSETEIEEALQIGDPGPVHVAYFLIREKNAEISYVYENSDVEDDFSTNPESIDLNESDEPLIQICLPSNPKSSIIEEEEEEEEEYSKTKPSTTEKFQPTIKVNTQNLPSHFDPHMPRSANHATPTPTTASYHVNNSRRKSYATTPKSPDKTSLLHKIKGAQLRMLDSPATAYLPSPDATSPSISVLCDSSAVRVEDAVRRSLNVLGVRCEDADVKNEVKCWWSCESGDKGSILSEANENNAMEKLMERLLMDDGENEVGISINFENVNENSTVISFSALSTKTDMDKVA
ncbi:hypothetical protein HK096_000341, partial [Nowakowskiella sp. JEL0078]